MSFHNAIWIVIAILAATILADLAQILWFFLPRALRGEEPSVGYRPIMRRFSSIAQGKIDWADSVLSAGCRHWDMELPESRLGRWGVYFLVALMLLGPGIITFPTRLCHRCKLHRGHLVLTGMAAFLVVICYLVSLVPDDIKVIGIMLLMAGCILWLAGALAWSGLAFLASLPGRIWRRYHPVPPPPPPAKPIICKNTRDHVTVVCPVEWYTAAVRWHRDAVEKGYRAPSEKIVVPGFLYYDASTPIGQKGRNVGSGCLSWFKDFIEPRCWVEMRPDIYVPFSLEHAKRWGFDAVLFPANKEMHTWAMEAIFGEYRARPKHDIPLPAPVPAPAEAVS